jgi:hypothetical protein
VECEKGCGISAKKRMKEFTLVYDKHTILLLDRVRSKNILHRIYGKSAAKLLE